MCGFAGFWQNASGTEEALHTTLKAMTDPIVHRGPDDDGVWADPAHGIGLGFRRLAILDLSQAGHQPMGSATGRYQMVFNGEMYNHAELKEALGPEAPRFRGHSDTEVILACFEAWGIPESLKRFNGMFAIALWDREERKLHLARDRMGIKPLFIQRTETGVLFGSELKALRAHPAFVAELDPQGIGEYLKWLYVAAPRTVFKRTEKLLPGHVLTLDQPNSPNAPESYWTLGPGTDEECSPDLTEAVDQLETLLSDAVKLRMVADVPLGALLSGGVDSSTIVGLMQAQASRAVKTFSIGFDQAEHDESHHAAAVAKHLGTDHTAVHLTSKDALDVVPRLPSMFDEPLADPSQIPTYLVSAVARKDVIVALSGDGGDELFAGYNRYRFGPRWAAALSRVPKPLRTAIGAALRKPGSSAWDSVGETFGKVPGVSTPRLLGEKVSKIGGMALNSSQEAMLGSLSTVGFAPEDVGRREFFGPITDRNSPRPTLGTSLAEQMMAQDQVSYLPDDLLAKVDRASMAVSLEVRVPILDHRVVEFSWRTPMGHKLGEDGGKTILKRLLYRYVPEELVNRPKVGFTPPVAHWLATGLSEWAGDLFASDGPGIGELWNGNAVQAKWAQFQAGQREHALGLWALAQFQAWHREFLR